LAHRLIPLCIKNKTGLKHQSGMSGFDSVKCGTI